MAAGLRLRGQEVSIKVTSAGNVVTEVSGNIGSFNNEDGYEIKEDGFLGEKTNRYDQNVTGYSGDFEFQVNKASWGNVGKAIRKKAQREDTTLVFNVIRTNIFADGSTKIDTFADVSWGPISETVGSRADFVKVKMSFKTSDKDEDINAI
jgi:hypothetical protein